MDAVAFKQDHYALAYQAESTRLRQLASLAGRSGLRKVGEPLTAEQAARRAGETAQRALAAVETAKAARASARSAVAEARRASEAATADRAKLTEEAATATARRDEARDAANAARQAAGADVTKDRAADVAHARYGTADAAAQHAELMAQQATRRVERAAQIMREVEAALAQLDGVVV